MPIPAALQIGFLVASVAFVALAACLIAAVLRASRQLEKLVVTIGEVRADLDVLVEESRDLVRNVNTLVTRANDGLKDVEEVVGAVRTWKSRADRVVSAIGAIVEPPVFSLARNVSLLRMGVTASLRALSHDHHRDEARRQTIEENNHG
jgi:uncharacterized protein YoxC